MRRFTIRSKADLIAAIDEFGILPFFSNSIAGFSIEEHIAPRLWFTENEGPWEWKGPVIRETGCGYGKFFEHKAAFVSPRWFLTLANFRRDGYDFDARCDDGLVALKDQALYTLIDRNAPIISKSLKQLGDYRKGGNKGFDTVINRLEHQCYVVISDFVYMTDRNGEPYGWGVAEYSTPERLMGAAFTDAVYTESPEQSYEKLFAHLTSLFPDEDADTLCRFLR